MWFLFFEIWLWLLLAYVAGWISHWFFCCRDKDKKSRQKESPLTASAVAESVVASSDNQEVVAANMADQWKPLGFIGQPEQVDDLKKIKGVGAKIESTLNELGFYQYQQIADWDDNNVEWVESFLSFPGRINREDWRGQATLLASGESTDFSSKVDRGDVDY